MFKKIFLPLLIILLLSPSIVHAQNPLTKELCTLSFNDDIKKSLLDEQAEFEKTVLSFDSKKNTFTPKIVTAFIENLRIYRAKQMKTCNTVQIKMTEKDASLSSSSLASALANCTCWVNQDIEVWKLAFEKSALVDASKKEKNTLIEKYNLDLNTKIINLLETLILIQGEFARLVKNIGDSVSGQQFP